MVQQRLGGCVGLGCQQSLGRGSRGASRDWRHGTKAEGMQIRVMGGFLALLEWFLPLKSPPERLGLEGFCHQG